MKTHPLHSGRDASRFFTLLAAVLFVPLLFVQSSRAFSLLGPYTDWMSATNGYRQAGDIGGPMDINEEYRWNVPTITYGFDKSFVDYFGSNGVAAVESAIQILNDLPAASDIALNDYPVDTRRLNAVAAAQNVYDLKSTALGLLMQQLGLGRPAANILDIRTWNPSLLQVSFCGDENCPALVNFPSFLIRRNFDPVTLAPSFVVNDLAYGGMFMTNYYGNSVIPFVVDPLSSPYSAVAEAFGANPGLQTGFFYTGLTRDDVGGLRYLLSATNVNWEALPKERARSPARKSVLIKNCAASRGPALRNSPLYGSRKIKRVVSTRWCFRTPLGSSPTGPSRRKPSSRSSGSLIFCLLRRK